MHAASGDLSRLCLHCTRLVELNVFHTGIETGVHIFGSVPQLQRLQLAESENISGAISIFEMTPNLIELILFDTQVTGKPFRPFVGDSCSPVDVSQGDISVFSSIPTIECIFLFETSVEGLDPGRCESYCRESVYTRLQGTSGVFKSALI